MVLGIVIQIAITLVLALIAWVSSQVIFMKGFRAGMQHEAKGWVDALTKVTPPNWQSIPTPPGYDADRAKAAAQVYVEAFKVALDVIKEEIAMNRIEALAKELSVLAQETEGNG
jgi:hypothetical protein